VTGHRSLNLDEVKEEREGARTAGSSRGLWEVVRRHQTFLILLVVLDITTCVALLGLELHLKAAWDLMRLMAITRSMAQFTLPAMGGSHLTPSSDPHFGPYILLLALVWRSVGSTPENLNRVFSVAGVLGATLLAVSLYRLCLFLFGKPLRAAACTAAAFLMWGPAHTYWAGDYSVLGMMYASMYPQTFGYILALWCLLIYLRHTIMPRTRNLVALSVLFWGLIVTHQLTSLLLIIAMLPVAALQVRRQGGPVVALATGAVFTFLWPFYSAWGSYVIAAHGPKYAFVGVVAGATFLVLTGLAVRFVWMRWPKIAGLFH